MIPTPVPVDLPSPSIPPRGIPRPVELFGWGPVAQSLMGSLIVVELEVGAQFPPGIRGEGVSFQVHLLVFHGAPQPLHEYVVSILPLPVHADLHAMVLQDMGELPAGELAPLVGVEHLRPTLPQRLLQGVDTEASFQVLDNRQATT